MVTESSLASLAGAPHYGRACVRPWGARAQFLRRPIGPHPAITLDTATTVAAAGFIYPTLTENPQIDALDARAQAIYAELHKSLASAGNGGAAESSVVMSVGGAGSARLRRLTPIMNGSIC
jgi:hypothetical protein